MSKTIVRKVFLIHLSGTKDKVTIRPVLTLKLYYISCKYNFLSYSDNQTAEQEWNASLTAGEKNDLQQFTQNSFEPNTLQKIKFIIFSYIFQAY